MLACLIKGSGLIPDFGSVPEKAYVRADPFQSHVILHAIQLWNISTNRVAFTGPLMCT